MSKFAVDDNGVECEIVSRKEAIEKGLDRYFTGKPCKHDHLNERYVSTRDCVECKSIYNKSDIKRKYDKEYRKINKEYIAERNKEYQKEYYQANKESIAEYNKKYGKRYRKVNKEYIREHKKEYERTRYATNLDYRLTKVCRSMLKRTLKATTSTKHSRTYEMLGYCNEQLKQSISSKFLGGMTWDNYGELWHIDHVYPVARYISDGIKDPAIINHLDNLIPMWAEDNLDKSSMTLEEYLEAYPEKKEVYEHFLD